VGEYSERRNASAAYELALRSERPYQAGDQVSYYVAGDKTRVKVNEAAKLATEWDPAAPDENLKDSNADRVGEGLEELRLEDLKLPAARRSLHAKQ